MYERCRAYKLVQARKARGPERPPVKLTTSHCSGYTYLVRFTMSYTIERLIIEIESRPAIWDSRTKEYSNRIIKRNAWEELCAALKPNFEEMTSAEKCLTGTTIQKKWKSIRDAFSRELKKNNSKSGSGTKISKPYAYFNNLLFLKPLYETKPKEQDNTDGNEILNIEDDINDDHINASDIYVQTTKPSTSGKRKYEEHLFKILADSVLNKRRNMETGDNDPDKQFLLSLLPDLKNMDQSTKFDVKFDIMSVMKRYKDFNKPYSEYGYRTGATTQYSSSPSNASPPSVSSSPSPSTSNIHTNLTEYQSPYSNSPSNASPPPVSSTPSPSTSNIDKNVREYQSPYSNSPSNASPPSVSSTPPPSTSNIHTNFREHQSPECGEEIYRDLFKN
ncbi:uncharacterized protein LOC143921112 [Arctopsyche grandis]|uniref:uncharacterized protein LOC143921112 n=1 Tax=Arctopsyche grandis TaxID=121162 RepID=UPI00406D9C89